MTQVFQRAVLQSVAAAALAATIVSVGARAPETGADFPLRVDGRHLTGPSGRPFLVTGDTAWSLIAQLSDDDIDRYLDDRARRGFNAVIVNLIEHKFATRAPSTRDGVAPFLTPGDFTNPNPAYFDRAHRAIVSAGRRGIAVWLCPAYLGWKGGDEGFFPEIAAAGPVAQREYGRFLGHRFRDLPNIVWMLGGDFALTPSERWTAEELVGGLREGGATQLMTAHGGQTSGVETFGDRPWVAVDTVYSYKPDLRPLLDAAYDRQPVRPFVMIESTYEGEHDVRPDQVRRQAWASVLSGAAGQFFGNNPMWHFDGPTLFAHSGDWRQALDSPGSRDMSRLASFFGAREWWKLSPERGHPSASIARSADGRLAVAYIPSTGVGETEVAIPVPAATTARWFNPARDEPPREAFPAHSPFRTPGDNGMGANDWVLVLEGRR